MRNLYIDDTKVELLLEKHKNSIGVSSFEWFETIFSGIFFIASNVFADYNTKYSLAIKTACIIIGLILVVRGVYLVVDIIKNKYTHTDLYNDLKNLDQVTHPFSIVAIMDTFSEYPNRFLLYYDTRWDCDFFFSYKTQEHNNSQNIISRLSRELHIDPSYITVDFKTSRIQSKFSESDKVDKIYEHKLYCAHIESFEDRLKQDCFDVDGKHYRWMTIEDMEHDANIQKKNLDVVALVKEFV